MYLSKLQLNPAFPGVKRDLASLYEMHRTICRGIEFDSSGKCGRLLFHREGEKVTIVSEQKPDWKKLPRGYVKREFPLLDYEKLNLEEGEEYWFRLRANPTVTRFNEEKGKRKRYGLYTSEKQNAWIYEQAQKNGFEILDLYRDEEGFLGAKNKGVRFFSVLFEGALKIRDKEKFTRALYNGIGAGKGFGFGLLSISRG